MHEQTVRTTLTNIRYERVYYYNFHTEHYNAKCFFADFSDDGKKDECPRVDLVSDAVDLVWGGIFTLTMKTSSAKRLIA